MAFRTRNQFVFAFTHLITATLATCYCGTSARADEPSRPNILLIVTDDQSPFDFKFYNDTSTLDAPNIDRLAQQGMVIDGAYHMGAWSGAVCTPSRHMIMTGRTVWHLPYTRSKPRSAGKPSKPYFPGNPAHVPADLADHSLAAVFNRAGYHTMRTCKIGNSYPAANEKFTVCHDKSNRGGDAETGSAWHAERVLDYLESREQSGKDNPFLIYLGFSHPHDTRDGTPELIEKYGVTNHTDPHVLPTPHADRAPKLPINYLPAHPFHHGHLDLRDELKVSGVWGRRDEASIRNELGREYACAENIDIQVGRVLDKLETMGQLDNTLVIYTSDHGIAIGRHGLLGKQNLYEHTWRVPMIARGPGIAPGTRATGNIYLLDLLATACDFAGIQPPETNEGTSFRPVLLGEQTHMRDTLYGVYSGGTKPGMRAVRRGDWKLIKYDVLEGKVRKTQLFNLAENPWELLAEHQHERTTAATGNSPAAHQRNLANDPKHQSKLREMEALLLKQQQAHDDPYRLWDQPKL